MTEGGKFMIEEKICISNDEEKILLETIGQKMILISTEDPLNFNENFIWTLYCDFGKIYFKIERKDIVAKMFDIDEDGGNFFISKVQPQKEHKIVTKTINRTVQDVCIVEVNIEFEDYKIQYPKAVIFQFEDCNLVIEKSWIFSLAGFLVRLEQTSDETFGFMDEVSFWYDPEVSEKKPLATQKIISLKSDKITSVKQI